MRVAHAVPMSAHDAEMPRSERRMDLYAACERIVQQVQLQERLYQQQQPLVYDSEHGEHPGEPMITHFRLSR